MIILAEIYKVLGAKEFKLLNTFHFNADDRDQARRAAHTFNKALKNGHVVVTVPKTTAERFPQ